MIDINKGPTTPDPKTQDQDRWKIVHLIFTAATLVLILNHIYWIFIVPFQDSDFLSITTLLILNSVKIIYLLIMVSAFFGLIKKQRMGWIGLRAGAIFSLLTILSTIILPWVMRDIWVYAADSSIWNTSMLLHLSFFISALFFYNTPISRKQFPLTKDDGNIALVISVPLWILQIMVFYASNFIMRWMIDLFS